MRDTTSAPLSFGLCPPLYSRNQRHPRPKSRHVSARQQGTSKAKTRPEAFANAQRSASRGFSLAESSPCAPPQCLLWALTAQWHCSRILAMFNKPSVFYLFSLDSLCLDGRLLGPASLLCSLQPRETDNPRPQCTHSPCLTPLQSGSADAYLGKGISGFSVCPPMPSTEPHFYQSLPCYSGGFSR